MSLTACRRALRSMHQYEENAFHQIEFYRLFYAYLRHSSLHTVRHKPSIPEPTASPHLPRISMLNYHLSLNPPQAIPQSYLPLIENRSQLDFSFSIRQKRSLYGFWLYQGFRRTSLEEDVTPENLMKSHSGFRYLDAHRLSLSMDFWR